MPIVVKQTTGASPNFGQPIEKDASSFCKTAGESVDRFSITIEKSGAYLTVTSHPEKVLFLLVTKNGQERTPGAT